MEKRDILFAIFGSVICLFTGIGLYFVGKSNKKFIKELEKEKFRKEQTSN